MKKSFLEIFLTPLVIALVGCLGTYFVTNQQLKSSVLQSKTQLESTERLTKSDQQIKIIEIFSEKITSKDIREREIAVRILSALDPDLGGKLIEAIAQSSKEDTVIRNVAIQLMADESSKGYSYPVLSSFTSLTEAVSAAKKLQQKNLSYEIHIYEASNGFYAVCLGGKLSLTESKIRVNYAKTNGISKEAYVRTTDKWKENLLK
jgi:hypothetical protein